MPGVHAVAACSAVTFPRHMHDQYGIGLITRGAQKSLSGRGMVEASAGNLITCNPAEVHDGTPARQEERAWTMLYFDPEPVSQAVADITGNTGVAFEFESPSITDLRMAGMFRELFIAITSPAEREYGGTQEALLELLASMTRQTPSLSAAPEKNIARVKARIDDDPAEATSLLELAGNEGLSCFQLLRGFRKAVGLTPHAYRVQRRLHLARLMIIDRTPLAHAAAASGFADQSHMTRLFVRSYGLSPGAYARTVL